LNGIREPNGGVLEIFWRRTLPHGSFAMTIRVPEFKPPRRSAAYEL
jgi:hypothetical protein